MLGITSATRELIRLIDDIIRNSGIMIEENGIIMDTIKILYTRSLPGDLYLAKPYPAIEHTMSINKASAKPK